MPSQPSGEDKERFAFRNKVDYAVKAGKQCEAVFPAEVTNNDDGGAFSACAKGKYITGLKKHDKGFYLYCAAPCDSNASLGKCRTYVGKTSCSMSMAYMAGIGTDKTGKVTSVQCCGLRGGMSPRIASSITPSKWSSADLTVCDPVPFGTKCSRAAVRFLNDVSDAKNPVYCGYTNSSAAAAAPTTAPTKAAAAANFRSGWNSPVEDSETLLAVNERAATADLVDTPFRAAAGSCVKFIVAGVVAVVAVALLAVMSRARRGDEIVSTRMHGRNIAVSVDEF
jgi:hypothetical protein